MLKVRVPRGAIDQDVVEEDGDELAKEWAKELVHGSLESRRSVAETERHDAIFIMAGIRTESGLGDVFLGHADLMESLAEVELREARGGTELIQELINGGHRELVLDGDGVEGAIINATAPGTVLLFYEEDGGRIWVVTEANEVGVEHGADLVLELCLLAMGVPVRFDRDGLGVRQ